MIHWILLLPAVALGLFFGYTLALLYMKRRNHGKGEPLIFYLTPTDLHGIIDVSEPDK